MTETQKKPRKKAAPKAQADADTQKDKRDDQQLREAVLAAALPHAAFDSFTDSLLQKAGAEAGVAKTDLKRLFEDGPISLIEFYSAWADAEMEKKLAAMDLKSMKIRERIAAAVKARLAILKPHKEAARRAAAMLSLPMHAALGAKLMYRTVDAMWRAAGDTSTDFNFYTKRGILAGVYGSTAMRWFNDTSADEKPTDDFLAARIENVMQFEKFKAKAKEALSNFPAFADWAKPKPKSRFLMIEKKPKPKIAKHKASNRSAGKFLATVHLLSTQEGGRSKAFRDDFRPQLYLTDPDINTTCFIHLIGGLQEVNPGETAIVEASLLIPSILAPLQPKTKFWLREGGRTIGWGVVKRLV